MIKWLKKRWIESDVRYVEEIHKIKREYLEKLMSHVRLEDISLIEIDGVAKIYGKVDESFVGKKDDEKSREAEWKMS